MTSTAHRETLGRLSLSEPSCRRASLASVRFSPPVVGQACCRRVPVRRGVGQVCCQRGAVRRLWVKPVVSVPPSAGCGSNLLSACPNPPAVGQTCRQRVPDRRPPAESAVRAARTADRRPGRGQQAAPDRAPAGVPSLASARPQNASRNAPGMPPEQGLTSVFGSPGRDARTPFESAGGRSRFDRSSPGVRRGPGRRFPASAASSSARGVWVSVCLMQRNPPERAVFPCPLPP